MAMADGNILMVVRRSDNAITSCGNNRSCSSRFQFTADFIQGAFVVAKPICVTADSPVVDVKFDNGHPNSIRVLREMRFPFGEHDDFREIADQVLLGESVEA